MSKTVKFYGWTNNFQTEITGQIHGVNFWSKAFFYIYIYFLYIHLFFNVGIVIRFTCRYETTEQNEIGIFYQFLYRLKRAWWKVNIRWIIILCPLALFFLFCFLIPIECNIVNMKEKYLNGKIFWIQFLCFL